MVDAIPITFDFKHVWLSATNNIFYNMNRSGKFDLAEMDGTTKNFEVVLCSACPESIADCINDQGCLTDQCTIINLGDFGDVALKYNYIENSGITVEFPIDTLVYDSETEEINIKACFIRQKQTGYVIGYDILTQIVPLGNMMLPMYGIVFKLEINR